METNKLHDKEFKVIVIKMITNLRRRLDEHNENFNKETESIKNTKQKL